MREPAARRAALAAARTVGWNVLLLLAGLALIAAGGEAWLRLTKPFMHPVEARRFVPGVGFTRTPGAEVRWTNGRDIWTVSRANSLGFLDREPPPPGKAAQSCHVTVIGDSFVEAREVAVPDKLQVRLEALAAGELPELEVTTSAFGMTDTGQIEQLPFYDAFARRLRPKLVVLVFVHNDWHDNNRTSSLRFSADATGKFQACSPCSGRDEPIYGGGGGGGGGGGAAFLPACDYTSVLVRSMAADAPSVQSVAEAGTAAGRRRNGLRTGSVQETDRPRRRCLGYPCGAYAQTIWERPVPIATRHGGCARHPRHLSA